MTRAFVAVRLPAEAIDELGSRTAELTVRGLRVMTSDQWHLTLQFLGDAADITAVGAALAGFSVPGGVIRLGNAGAFPSARRARVVWIGLAEGEEMVARLAAEVAGRLAPLGYERDEKPFRAHITVGRGAKPVDARGPIAELDATAVGAAWRADELTVYESELRPQGARYVARVSVPLPR